MRVEHIGDATLYLADCMDVMRDMPDKAFDLAIVDPPYGDGGGIGRTRSGADSADGSNAMTPPKVSRTGGTWAKKYQTEGGCPSDIRHWDFAPPPEYFKELFRVSKRQIVWGGNYFSLPPSQNFIVWRKLTISEGFSMAMAEYAWTNIPGNAKIFECAPQGTVNNPRFHPTQKPVALYKWLLKNYTKPGDKILDTHGGSGSSVIACLDMGYSITWIEKDVNYFEAALKRIKDFAAQPKLPMDDTPEPVEQWLGFEEEL
jgi:site-specific DNA-methyltransferase (adenine-specific)